MQNHSKKSKSQLRRQQMEAAQAAKEKQKKMMNRIMWISVAAILAIAAIIVTVVIIQSNRVTYRLADPEKYALSQTTTNLVKMNVSYTLDNGEKHNGDIIIELDAQNAPITVANFQKLVGEGFYDGIVFHRQYNDLIIQGGDPQGTGMGGSKETIKGEFSENGVTNNISHKRGVISMARLSNDYNSASSQFFIMTQDFPQWDGSYAAFGKVIFGMETVDGISSMKTNSDDIIVGKPVINSAVFVTEVSK